MPSFRNDVLTDLIQEYSVARKNYSFEKRQRELAKKKKQEDKRLQKAAAQRDKTEDDTVEAPEGAGPEDAQRSQP